YGAQCAFRSIIVDLDDSVVAVAGQRLPARQSVPDRLAELRFLRDLPERRVHPAMQCLELRPGSGLALSLADLGQLAAYLLLDGVELADTIKRFARQRRARGQVDVVKLAAHMS